MGIADKLMDLKFHSSSIIIGSSVAVAFISIIVMMGPSLCLSTVVNFFWPLLLSTGFFLAAVAVLLKISPPPVSETVADLAGEELMDFVAGGQPQHHQDSSPLIQEEEGAEKSEDNYEERGDDSIVQGEEAQNAKLMAG